MMGGSTVVHKHHMRKVLLCLIPSWRGWGWRGRGGWCGGRRRFHHLACLQEANQIGIRTRILHKDDHVGNAHHQRQQLQGLHFHQVLRWTIMMVKYRTLCFRLPYKCFNSNHKNSSSQYVLPLKISSIKTNISQSISMSSILPSLFTTSKWKSGEG